MLEHQICEQKYNSLHTHQGYKTNIFLRCLPAHGIFSHSRQLKNYQSIFENSIKNGINALHIEEKSSRGGSTNQPREHLPTLEDGK